MVQLVRKSNSLTILLFLYLHIFAGPFHSQFKRYIQCQTIYGDLSVKSARLHSADKFGRSGQQAAKASRPLANSESLDGTIIVQDEPDYQLDRASTKTTSYCDEISELLYGNKSLYCVDYSYCPSIDAETEQQVRQLTCGIKYDGSMRVCCNVLSEGGPISGRSSASSEGTLVVTDGPIQVSRSKKTRNNSTESALYTRSTSESRVPRSSYNFPKECGLSVYSENQYETRIIGGETAQKNAWPWFASIMFQRKPGGRKSPECGGTLISDKFVLTAAHCVLEQSRLSKPVRMSMLTVRLAEHDLKSADGEVDFGVAKIYAHPKFNSKTFKNDIALLELDRKVTFGDTIEPACLPHDVPALSNMSANALVGQQAWVIGFGQTSYNGRTSDNLKQADLRIYDHDRCEHAFSHLLTIGAEYVCASSFDPVVSAEEEKSLSSKVAGGSKPLAKDSCKGDSGGPLLVQSGTGSPKRWYVYGIVSFGYKCATADYPGVYTRVNHYLDWIGSLL